MNLDEEIESKDLLQQNISLINENEKMSSKTEYKVK